MVNFCGTGRELTGYVSKIAAEEADQAATDVKPSQVHVTGYFN